MKILAYVNLPQDEALYDMLKHINKTYKNIEITFLANKNAPLTNNLLFKNIKIPKFKNRYIKHVWSSLFLNKILKKYNNPIFLQSTSNLLLTSYTNQYLFITHNHFSKAMISVIKNAKHIFTAERFLTDLIIKNFNKKELQVTTTYYNISYKSIGNENDTFIKNKYCNGADYFFCEINNTNTTFIIDILKAFSQFKKWQKSTIKIVFYATCSFVENLIPNFNNYKYKADVIFVEEGQIHADYLIAAAFGLLYFTEYRLQHFAAKAWLHKVPVIAHDTAINQSLLADSAQYANMNTLAQAMQELYKNEILCNNLTTNGTAHIQKYNIDEASKKMKQVFENFTN